MTSEPAAPGRTGRADATSTEDEAAAGLHLHPLTAIGEVRPGDDLAALLLDAAAAAGIAWRNGDVAVIAQRIASKAEDRVRPLAEFAPSPLARRWAAQWGRDPRLVEAVLSESTRIVRQARGVLITEHRLGMICANAAVDTTNLGPGPAGERVSLLPLDPDATCRGVRDRVRAATGARIAVVMTDTFGRPWREGQTNVAIGLAGMRPLRPLAGTVDRDGVELRVTEPCVADELAAACGLLMGKATGIPAVHARGVPFVAGEGSAREIVRPFERDLFP